MRSWIVGCVAGVTQIAASFAAAAQTISAPAPIDPSAPRVQVAPGLPAQKRARYGLSEQRLLQNPMAQQILRDPELQQQIMDDPRFESLKQDPQAQQLMQNPQVLRQMQQNQQLQQMYQLQRRPLPGVTADEDD
jgi:hypothetical protein